MTWQIPLPIRQLKRIFVATWYVFHIEMTVCAPIQEHCRYSKQGPSPISLVRATRIFSQAKTMKQKFDLPLDIGDNLIYPF